MSNDNGAARHPREYPELLRQWKFRVCAALEMNPAQVFRLNEKLQSAPWPYEPGWDLHWRAIEPQQPTGVTAYQEYPWSDGENSVCHKGTANLTPTEWAAVLEVAGPKPQLFTREQELILKGLAAEEREGLQS